MKETPLSENRLFTGLTSKEIIGRRSANRLKENNAASKRNMNFSRKRFARGYLKMKHTWDAHKATYRDISNLSHSQVAFTFAIIEEK